MGDNDRLEEKINDILQLHLQLGIAQGTEDLTENWSSKVNGAPQKLYHDNRINWDVLRKFRRRGIFLDDGGPYSDFSRISLKRAVKKLGTSPLTSLKGIGREIIDGKARGLRKDLIEKFELMRREGAEDLLRKNDIDLSAGNPFVFEYKGCRYNARWLRHNYFVNLLRRHLADDIQSKNRFISADIGSAYGIFSLLFKREFENTTQILIDFPDQLVTAFYFLSRSYPGAKIATVLDFHGLNRLDRNFLSAYDFVLVPTVLFDRLDAGSVDMFTNFVSLGEMMPKWFDSYVQSDCFKQARYFFTCNRFLSSPRLSPTHGTPISILDYPLRDFQRIHFDICPLFYTYVERKKTFFYSRLPYSSQQFEFIGRRKP